MKGRLLRGTFAFSILFTIQAESLNISSQTAPEITNIPVSSNNLIQQQEDQLAESSEILAQAGNLVLQASKEAGLDLTLPEDFSIDEEQYYPFKNGNLDYITAYPEQKNLTLQEAEIEFQNITSDILEQLNINPDKGLYDLGRALNEIFDLSQASDEIEVETQGNNWKIFKISPTQKVVVDYDSSGIKFIRRIETDITKKGYTRRTELILNEDSPYPEFSVSRTAFSKEGEELLNTREFYLLGSPIYYRSEEENSYAITEKRDISQEEMRNIVNDVTEEVFIQHGLSPGERGSLEKIIKNIFELPSQIQEATYKEAIFLGGSSESISFNDEDGISYTLEIERDKHGRLTQINFYGYDENYNFVKGSSLSFITQQDFQRDPTLPPEASIRIYQHGGWTNVIQIYLKGESEPFETDEWSYFRYFDEEARVEKGKPITAQDLQEETVEILNQFLLEQGVISEEDEIVDDFSQIPGKIGQYLKKIFESISQEEQEVVKIEYEESKEVGGLLIERNVKQYYLGDKIFRVMYDQNGKITEMEYRRGERFQPSREEIMFHFSKRFRETATPAEPPYQQDLWVSYYKNEENQESVITDWYDEAYVYGNVDPFPESIIDRSSIEYKNRVSPWLEKELNLLTDPEISENWKYSLIVRKYNNSEWGRRIKKKVDKEAVIKVFSDLASDSNLGNRLRTEALHFLYDPAQDEEISAESREYLAQAMRKILLDPDENESLRYIASWPLYVSLKDYGENSLGKEFREETLELLMPILIAEPPYEESSTDLKTQVARIITRIGITNLGEESLAVEIKGKIIQAFVDVFSSQEIEDKNFRQDLVDAIATMINQSAEELTENGFTQILQETIPSLSWGLAEAGRLYIWRDVLKALSILYENPEIEVEPQELIPSIRDKMEELEPKLFDIYADWYDRDTAAQTLEEIIDSPFFPLLTPEEQTRLQGEVQEYNSRRYLDVREDLEKLQNITSLSEDEIRQSAEKIMTFLLDRLVPSFIPQYMTQFREDIVINNKRKVAVKLLEAMKAEEKSLGTNIIREVITSRLTVDWQKEIWQEKEILVLIGDMEREPEASEIKEIKIALNAPPSEHLKNIGAIVLESQPNSEEMISIGPPREGGLTILDISDEYAPIVLALDVVKRINEEHPSIFSLKRVLLHEIGHVRHEFLSPEDKERFIQLSNESGDEPNNYAREYGMYDLWEDFATVYEAYISDTIEILQRARAIALDEDNPSEILLGKLKLIAKLFIDKETNMINVYRSEYELDEETGIMKHKLYRAQLPLVDGLPLLPDNPEEQIDWKEVKD